jgi:hypothetical protein
VADLLELWKTFWKTRESSRLLQPSYTSTLKRDIMRGGAAALLVLLIAGPRTGGCGTSMLLRAQARACMRPAPPAAASASRAFPGVCSLRGGSGEEGEEAPSIESSGGTEEGSEVEATGDDPVGHVPDNAPASCPGTQAAEAGKADGCAGCPNQVMMDFWQP